MKISTLLLHSTAYALIIQLMLPVAAFAADAPVTDPVALRPLSPVLITELQTASSSTGKSDEFIELYNAGAEAVDITGWQLRYLNASNEAATPSGIATIMPGSGKAAVLLAPGAYYVLHTSAMTLSEGSGDGEGRQLYDATLSAADKVVALFKPDSATCTYSVQDALAWGTSSMFETAPLAVPIADKNAERHIQRYRDASGIYIDTNNNAFDARLSAAGTVAAQATPGALNTAVKTLLSAPVIHGALPTFKTMSVPDCEMNVTVPPVEGPEPAEPDVPPVTTPPLTEPPVATPDTPPSEDNSPPIDTRPTVPASKNTGLAALHITEVLPNPASPQTDAQDEFIELYNSNAAAFDLSGYMIEVSTTTKRRYTFPLGSSIEAGQFKAFFSADTRLPLTNGGSQVALLDPLGNAIASSEAYTEAKDGLAWARVNGAWVWTASPTPHAANAVTAPPAKKAAVPVAAAAAAKSVKTTKAAASPKAPAKPAAAKAKATKPVKESKQAKQTMQATSVASLTPKSQIHGGILALVGVSAVLYGAYEYRHDLANYIYRLRTNRTARGEVGGKP